MSAVNKGKPWTSDELETLLSGFRSKKTEVEIAEEHGRTVNAVRFKALGYACDQVLKHGKTKEDVLLELGLSETDLQNELDKRTMPRAIANTLVKVNTAKPSVAKPSKPLVVKKAAAVDDLSEIMSSVNRLQSLVHRYLNTVRK